MVLATNDINGQNASPVTAKGDYSSTNDLVQTIGRNLSRDMAAFFFTEMLKLESV